MSQLIDQMAERHIQSAVEQGELSNLPGEGKPIQLDDDRQVPQELRAAYRILKNSGNLPPELELRKQALQLCDFLAALPTTEEQQLAEHQQKLRTLELKLKIKGVNTQFISHYLHSLPSHD